MPQVLLYTHHQISIPYGCAVAPYPAGFPRHFRPGSDMRMTEFTCTRCGKCCISLGRHMRITRSSSQFSHTLSVKVTGETRPVQVNPELRDLFLLKGAPAYEEGWCPFLRRTAEGMFVCTVYFSRPAICRSFRCCTMRILDREGRERGRVKGRHSLSTDDALLEKVWTVEIAPHSTIPDDEFFPLCQSILATRGYVCEIFDP